MDGEVITCEEWCDNESKYKVSQGRLERITIPWSIRSQLTAVLYMERNLVHYVVVLTLISQLASSILHWPFSSVAVHWHFSSLIPRPP